MNFKVLEDMTLPTPKGDVSLKKDQVIKIPHDITLQLINYYKIESVEPATYRIYSEILNDYLWIVEIDHDKGQLLSEGVQEPIYTHDEIKEMKGKRIPKDHLEQIHECKRVFKKSIVEDVKRKGEI